MHQIRSFVTVSFPLLFGHMFDLAVSHKGNQTDKEDTCKQNSAEMVCRKRSTYVEHYKQHLRIRHINVNSKKTVGEGCHVGLSQLGI